MILDVLRGVTEALYQEFGEGYEIYTEPSTQKLDQLSFLVLCQNPTMKQYLGKRWQSKNPCIIQFVQPKEESNREMYQVAERLYRCLDVVKINGALVRGRNLQAISEVIPLSFQVSYDFFFSFDKPTDMMELLEQQKHHGKRQEVTHERRNRNNATGNRGGNQWESREIHEEKGKGGEIGNTGRETRGEAPERGKDSEATQRESLA